MLWRLLCCWYLGNDGGRRYCYRYQKRIYDQIMNTECEALPYCPFHSSLPLVSTERFHPSKERALEMPSYITYLHVEFLCNACVAFSPVQFGRKDRFGTRAIHPFYRIAGMILYNMKFRGMSDHLIVKVIPVHSLQQLHSIFLQTLDYFDDFDDFASWEPIAFLVPASRMFCATHHPERYPGV